MESFLNNTIIKGKCLPKNASNDEKLRKAAFYWCQQLIGKGWSESFIENFKMTRVYGGLTNYLFNCQLISVSADDYEEPFPSNVLLRIYGEIVDSLTKFNEGVIFNIMSERKLGPKLLGAFPDGRIEQFLETSSLSQSEFTSISYVEPLARAVATYHMIEIPLIKDPKIFLLQLNSLLDFYKKNIDISIRQDPENASKLNELKVFDLEDQVRYLFEILENTNSPVVFSHNDLNEGNILKIPQAKDSENAYQVRLIDFEYSTYHYRGYDFGNLFNEFMIENNNPESPTGFKGDIHAYPSEEVQKLFFTSYLKQLELEMKDKPELVKKRYVCSVEALIEETKPFCLASNLYWALWGFGQYRLSKIPWSFLDYAICRAQFYSYYKFKYNF